MGVSLLFMVGLNRLWPVEKRHTENDLIGWQLNVLGTTYAVHISNYAFERAQATMHDLK
jgi:hypothetical protein